MDRLEKKIQLDSGIEITISEPILDDAQGIIDHAMIILEHDDFMVTLPEEFDFTVEQEEQWIRDHAEKEGWVAFAAKSEGKIIGLVTLGNRDRKRIQHVGTLAISIHPDCRRIGIGTLLMESLISWARHDSTIEKLALSVFVNNDAAISLYKKIGFTEEGRRRNEVKLSDGSYTDDFLMYYMVN